MPQGDANLYVDRLTDDAAERAERQRQFQENQQRATQMVGDAEQRQSSLLEQMIASNRERLANDRATAMTQFEQNRAQLGEQANRALSSPLSAPISVPVQAPVAPIDAVGANAGLAGANNALNEFFIAPERLTSQFTIGAPIGGGITNRQRGSQGNVTSDSDTLGARRKDEL